MSTTANTTIAQEIASAIEKAFLHKMEKSYTLVHIYCDCSFENNPKEIQACLNENSAEAINELVQEWVSDEKYSACVEIIESLKDEIMADIADAYLQEYVEQWIKEDNNFEKIRFEIEDRDQNDLTEIILKQTQLRSRASLYTNYDCLPHNYDMKNTYRYEAYFKDIIDVLCLNPSLVRKTFNQMGIDTKGEWIDIPERQGQEAVSYEALAEEMQNQSSYGLLTFMGMMPLSDLYENDFKEYEHIIIPKGNLCGLFNSWNGGGSLMEMELLRDLSVAVSYPEKTQYDTCSICVDERGTDKGYCIDEVYGINTSAWGKEFKLIYKNEKQ